MKKFKIPAFVKHKETIETINALIKNIEDKGNKLTPSDYPSLHRMATAYDIYLSMSEAIARDGATMVNLKGEVVKRPEVNIQKESWAQYLELAKEYGLTAKSRKILKIGSEDVEESPFDKFVNGLIEKR